MMSRRVPSRGFAAGIGIVVAAGVVAVLTGFLGVMPASSQAQIVQVRAASSVPRDDPFASFWDNVAPVEVALSAQNLTRPMAVQRRRCSPARGARRETAYVQAVVDDAQDARHTTTSFSERPPSSSRRGASCIPCFHGRPGGRRRHLALKAAAAGRRHGFPRTAQPRTWWSSNIPGRRYDVPDGTRRR
jgi:hypothetical protein